MVFCLLLGAVIFVAVITAIPTYTNGVLQNMLLRDLEAEQIREGYYPGNWQIHIPVSDPNEDIAHGFSYAAWYKNRIQSQFAPEMVMPVLASRNIYELDRFYFLDIEWGRERSVAVAALENLWDYVDIVTGRLPNADPSDNVLEFVMPLTEYQLSDIRLNEEFDIFSWAVKSGTDRLFAKAVCVGVFQPRFEEPYWYSTLGINSSPQMFVIDYDYMIERFVDPETEFVRSFSAFYCFDYTQIRMEDVNRMLTSLNRQHAELWGIGTMSFNMEQTLSAYIERWDSMLFMLWILLIPVIAILVLYIYMVTQLMVKNDSNEIAVLKSRGARNMDILLVYVFISLLIAGVAFIAGTPFGLWICRVLGLSNGFMEFVARQGLPFELSRESYTYAAFAAAGFMVIMIIPALIATRDTIVESKRKKSRLITMPLWQKLCLDVILILVSLYGLHLYRSNEQLRAIADVDGMSAPVDPMMLAASSLFVLGLSLFFLRIFPLIIKLIFRLGKNYWKPTIYSALLSVSRHRGNSQFLTLFIVFSVGLGLFNSATARTLNWFLEERVRYENGADITLSQVWPQSQQYVLMFNLSYDGIGTWERTNYYPGYTKTTPGTIGPFADTKEPSVEVFRQLDGVADFTKVYTMDEVDITSGRSTRFKAKTELMGIVPHEFGRISWFRDDLLPMHINHYLNIMTSDPSAVFLSSSLKDNSVFRVGDSVIITMEGQISRLEGMVYGFVDFWPSINPVLQPNFVIANLESIHRQMSVEPYSIWIKREEGVTSQEIYDSLIREEIVVSSLNDMQQELIEVKNDPLLKGVNGMLTLGFIITLCITFIGFLIYWILSIRSRLLQFGILRAIGLSRSKLIASLIWEQMLVSGSAILAGVGAGVLTGYLFVPTLQFMYSASEQVPPFVVNVNQSDFAMLFSTLAGMLIIGLAVLFIIIRQLKVDQVIKLGED